MDIISASKAIQSEMIKWRREIHQNPELDFDLPITSKYIKERLNEMKVTYSSIAQSGILGIIEGNSDGKTIGIRADMDALPIKEETGVDYSSKNNNMHACGHDAHVAMLLGVAKILSQNKNLFSGNIKLFFQPAEETSGGAKVMIEEGCLENPKVDAVLGLHVSQAVDAGKVRVNYGTVTAAFDEFMVKIVGKGGHGAEPHLCVDPITTAAEIITNIQKIVSREINPARPAVITVGTIIGGTGTNIIPQTVELTGDVRTVDPDDRVFVKKRLNEMCQNIALANIAEAIVEYEEGFPSCRNDDETTKKVAIAASKIIGSENVIVMKETEMGADDMAYFNEKIPGSYFYLGTRNPEKGAIYGEHNSKHNIDEDVLWIGTATLCQTVLDYLGGI